MLNGTWFEKFFCIGSASETVLKVTWNMHFSYNKEYYIGLTKESGRVICLQKMSLFDANWIKLILAYPQEQSNIDFPVVNDKNSPALSETSLEISSYPLKKMVHQSILPHFDVRPSVSLADWYAN